MRFIEQKLMDTLTLTQSKSAMEYNLMETNLMQLIDESNKKIKALENANNIIRFELQTYKCKTSSDINNEVYFIYSIICCDSQNF